MSAALVNGLVSGKRYLVGGAVVVPGVVVIGVLSHSLLAVAVCIVVVACIALKGTVGRKARAVALADIVGDPRQYNETWEYRRGHGPSARLIGTCCECCGSFVPRRADWVAGIVPLPKKTGLPDGVAPAAWERTAEHRYCRDCGLPWIARAADGATVAARGAGVPEAAQPATVAEKSKKAGGALLLAAALLPGALGFERAHSLAAVVVSAAWIAAVGIVVVVARLGDDRARRNPFLLAFVLLGILGFDATGAIGALHRIETENTTPMVGGSPMYVFDTGIGSYAQDSQALASEVKVGPTRHWWRVYAPIKIEKLRQDAELIGPTAIRVAALHEVAALHKFQRAEAAGAPRAIAQAKNRVVAADRRLAQVSASG